MDNFQLEDFGILEALYHDNFNLQLRSLFVFPDVVTAFEIKMQLPPTGDWRQMVRNYNREYYTIRAETESTITQRAIKSINSGYIGLIQDYLERGLIPNYRTLMLTAAKKWSIRNFKFLTSSYP